MATSWFVIVFVGIEARRGREGGGVLSVDEKVEVIVEGREEEVEDECNRSWSAGGNFFNAIK